MNKNNHIKIKERRWKRPRGGPTCLPILFILWACNFEKKKKMKLRKSMKNYLEKILAFVGDGGPFINMALALELQFPMKGIVCTYLFGVRFCLLI